MVVFFSPDPILENYAICRLHWQLEEAKLLRAQGRHSMAISLAEYVSQHFQPNEEASDVLRLVGKWLADTRSSK